MDVLLLFFAIIKFVTHEPESTTQTASETAATPTPRSTVTTDREAAMKRARLETANALKAVTASLENGTPLPNKVFQDRRKILGRMAILLQDGEQNSATVPEGTQKRR